MKEKNYGYENFTTHTQLGCEYKNAKNLRKKIWGEHFQNISKWKKIGDFQ